MVGIKVGRTYVGPGVGSMVGVDVSVGAGSIVGVSLAVDSCNGIVLDVDVICAA